MDRFESYLDLRLSSAMNEKKYPETMNPIAVGARIAAYNDALYAYRNTDRPIEGEIKFPSDSEIEEAANKQTPSDLERKFFISGALWARNNFIQKYIPSKMKYEINKRC